MNLFHKAIEKRVEPCNSKLLLLPAIKGLHTATLIEKQIQFCKKLMKKVIQVKKKDKVFYILSYQSKLMPHFVLVITVSPNSKREIPRIKLMTAALF